MDLLSDSPELLRIARRVTDATGAPIVGGLAVFLHGHPRTTRDVDLFAEDPRAVRAALELAGARWDGRSKEFLLEGVPVHLVTDKETGGRPRSTETRRGVLVVSLPDLVRFKLHSGLGNTNRARDVADVVELIRDVPLDKRFANRLPRSQRTAFKRLVDAVRGSPPERQ